MRTFTLELPAHWAPGLTNGEYSGLSEAELFAISAVLHANHIIGDARLSVSDETFHVPFDGLLTEMATYTFARPTKRGSK